MKIGLATTSSLVDAARLGALVAPGQKFLDTVFAPAWGVTGTLAVVAPGAPADLTVIVQDDVPADGAGDLAYHVDPAGHPTALVFAKAVLEDGGDLGAAVFHEICEALVDPLCDRMAPDGIDIVECCDAVEGTFLEVEGVLFPNFVLPRYFGLGGAGAAYDARGLLAGPAPALLPGGYLERYDPASRTWGRALGERAAAGWRQRVRGRRAFRRAVAMPGRAPG